MAHDDLEADEGVRRWFYGGTPPEDSAPANEPPLPPVRRALPRDGGADALVARAWATAALHRLRGPVTAGRS